MKTNGETNTFPICLFVLSEQLVLSKEALRCNLYPFFFLPPHRTLTRPEVLRVVRKVQILHPYNQKLDTTTKNAKKAAMSSANVMGDRRDRYEDFCRPRSNNNDANFLGFHKCNKFLAA
jgi:hypothetical protein